MQDEFDLDAYFERIGYRGPATPRLDTLCEIHRLHPQEIAFENLNPLLRRPVPLDIRSLQQKLVTQRRGGYCYEHNLLLKHALERIGFRVAGLAARVLMNAPESAIRPRTHMLLQVDIDDELWIADVGFGGMTLTAPLRLVEHVPQATPHEPFRLMRVSGDYMLQAEVRGEWRTLYRFDLQEQVLPDYELASWYLSNHPESHFVRTLIAARTQPQRRYALRNNELAVHELNGETTRGSLKSADALREALREMFGISIERSDELDARLVEIAESG
ncbi:MAG TPA: arylamine N-acetyltransferase [Steroidobacteraceae bacterium]|jgi:N-hydroxyarylamine O-acetyltransferase|nr:arylamine N-acetyltransferase [Steroidobacteraceae bacterium]